jgi:elongation factor G
VWGYAGDNALPRLIFINKMEMERANFTQTLKGIEEILGIKSLVLQMPIGEEASFRGVVDLVTMKAFLFSDDKSGECSEAPIPDEIKDRAEEMRGTMIEDIAESSDQLLEKYLEGATLTPEEILNGLTQGIQSCSLVPVLFGSAVNNMGVHQLLNLITACYPSPSERPFQGGRAALRRQRQRPVALRVQDRRRPLCGQADPVPRGFGGAQFRFFRVQCNQGLQGAHRADP